MEMSGLSGKEQKLIDNLAAGQGLQKAAKNADIGKPDRALLPLALMPQVRKYVRTTVRGRIDVEASPEAYHYLMRVLRDERHTPQLRVDVAKYLLSHSIAAPKAKEEDNEHEKNPSEMSNAELRQYIGSIEGELVDRNMLIDASPPQSIDDLI